MMANRSWWKAMGLQHLLPWAECLYLREWQHPEQSLALQHQPSISSQGLRHRHITIKKGSRGMLVGIPCSKAIVYQVSLTLVSYQLMASEEEWLGYVVAVFAVIWGPCSVIWRQFLYQLWCRHSTALAESPGVSRDAELNYELVVVWKWFSSRHWAFYPHCFTLPLLSVLEF